MYVFVLHKSDSWASDWETCPFCVTVLCQLKYKAAVTDKLQGRRNSGVKKMCAEVLVMFYGIFMGLGQVRNN